MPGCDRLEADWKTARQLDRRHVLATWSEQLPAVTQLSDEGLSEDEDLPFFNDEGLSGDEESWLPFNDDPSDLGFDPYAGQYLDEE